MKWVAWCALCAVAATGWVGQQGQAPPQKDAEVAVRQRASPDRGRAMLKGRAVDVTRHTLTVRIAAAEHARNGHVTVLMDDETGLYWWTLQWARDASENPVPAVPADLTRRGIDERWIVDFSEDRAVGFVYGDGVIIREMRRRERNSATVEAEILAELARQGSALVKGKYLEGLVEVPLGGPEVNEFRRVPNTAAPPRPPLVVAVTRRDGVWIVTLQGPKDDYAEVLLKDESYELAGFRVLGL